MNNDRELLERAAKAAGMNHLIPQIDFHAKPVFGCWWNINTDEEVWWNPLTDDGDALRLAVKLVDKQGEMLLAWMDGRIDFGDTIMKYASEEITDDSYAATRRAIVRAAAEIGKGMK